MKEDQMPWSNSLLQISVAEAEKKFPEATVAVITTGSTEQHDPRLPTGTAPIRQDDSRGLRTA